MESKSISKLKWEIQQRLASIEAALLWKGQVNRKDLKALFGIKEVQAAKDFARYHELHPGNMIYNAKIKSHIPTDHFKPNYLNGSPEEFLRLLQLSPTITTPNTSIALLSTIPSVEVVTAIDRAYKNSTLQIINEAICNQLQVSVQYQSMNRTINNTLQLSPHSFVNNGFRWHIRAYSESHKEHRDFLLARMKSILLTQESATKDVSQDEFWNTKIKIVIIPHPGLSPLQKLVIEDDYGMEQGRRIHTTRAALAGYFLQLMKIGIGDEQREAKAQQIILGNKEELRPYIF